MCRRRRWDLECTVWPLLYDPRKLNQILCCSWGGSRVVRFTKDGELDFQIIFPTALNVTACCFGGMYHCSLDPFLNIDILKVRTMTRCFSPLPTAELWEAMQVDRCSIQILVTFSGLTSLVDSEGWRGANLLVKYTMHERKKLYLSD